MKGLAGAGVSSEACLGKGLLSAHMVVGRIQTPVEYGIEGLSSLLAVSWRSP